MFNQDSYISTFWDSTSSGLKLNYVAVNHKAAESCDGINGCKLGLFLHCIIAHLDNRIKIRDVPSPIMWCTKNVRVSRKLGYSWLLLAMSIRLHGAYSMAKTGLVGWVDKWVGGCTIQAEWQWAEPWAGNINSWQDQLSTIWKDFKVGHEGSATATCNICKILRQLWSGPYVLLRLYTYLKVGNFLSPVGGAISMTQ